MSLVTEIAQWADTHSAWMSDAARRLFEHQAHSVADLDDIEALIKEAAGLPDSKGRRPARVDINMLPSLSGTGSTVSLTAIRDPKNLNAIGSGEGVKFEASGLNVVYGYNGSGKSGYARALKKACRARHVEAVIPNVFLDGGPPSGPASARMEWQDEGVPASEVWVDNVPSPEALSHIAVFDAHCARVFVDEQAAISYIPYGMDILTQLSISLKRIQTRLEEERHQRAFDRSSLLPLHGATDVGRLISTLSRKTKPENVRALATLSDAEASELRELQLLLQSDAATQQAKRLRQFCTRLDSLIAELEHLTSLLGETAASKLRQSFEQLHALFLANQLAASAFAEGYLQGTGTDPWERLLESAIEFAKVPYPDYEFPGPEGSNCVLCQQLLSPEAHSRLQEFLRFLRDDVQARFNACRREVNAKYQPVANAPIDKFPADKAILSELAEMIEGAQERVRGYVSALGERRQLIVAMAPSRVIDTLPTLPEVTLPLFGVALSPTITRPFFAVPRTSVARTASG